MIYSRTVYMIKKYALCHLPNNFLYETEITDLYDYHGDCIVTFTCNKHWF